MTATARCLEHTYAESYTNPQAAGNRAKFHGAVLAAARCLGARCTLFLSLSLSLLFVPSRDSGKTPGHARQGYRRLRWIALLLLTRRPTTADALLRLYTHAAYSRIPRARARRTETR